jgi:hypothetical protein
MSIRFCSLIRRVAVSALMPALSLLWMAPPAAAQQPQPAPQPEKRVNVMIQRSGAPGDVLIRTAEPAGFHMVGAAMAFEGPAVKGAPYSADAVNELYQKLADGNTISRNTSSKVYRDSEGRTRREQTLPNIGPWAAEGTPKTVIHISDPVAGVNYILHPDEKRAVKVPAPKVFFRSGDGQESKHMTVESGATVTHETRVERKIVIAGAGAPGDMSPGGPRVAAIGPVHDTMVFVNKGDAPKPESLGTQMINGVLAEGTRLVTTIPAGQIGNAAPLVTTSENWYSNDLKAMVKSTTSDPRMGDNTYELRNIVRAEPNPSLFQVPPDYTITEGPVHFEHKIEKK